MARLRQIENCASRVRDDGLPVLLVDIGGERHFTPIDFESVKRQAIEASDDYLASQRARDRKTQRLCVAFALIVIVYFSAQFARALLWA